VPTSINPFEPTPNEREHICRMKNRLIRRRIIDEHEAEDLDQEILRKLASQQSKFDPNQGERGGYSFRTIYNTVAHFLRNLRAPKRNPRTLKPSEQPVKGSRSRSVPFDEFDSRQQRDRRRGDRLTDQQEVERALDLADARERLPSELRDLFERRLDGMTISEAAKDLGIDRATAYRRFHELSERLRQIFPDGL
jgi:RNA polymerase sigma factor (sigma-70 family)